MPQIRIFHGDEQVLNLKPGNVQCSWVEKISLPGSQGGKVHLWRLAGFCTPLREPPTSSGGGPGTGISSEFLHTHRAVMKIIFEQKDKKCINVYYTSNG